MARISEELRRINNKQTSGHHQMPTRFLDLKAHDEWLQATLATLREAVVITDTAGGVTFMNAATQAITGWEPAADDFLPIPLSAADMR